MKFSTEDITHLLDHCERMANHTFVREALDLMNNPLANQKVANDELDQKNMGKFVRAARAAMHVTHSHWEYDLFGNVPQIARNMKGISEKLIHANKFSLAIDEIYFLQLLQNVPLEKYRYLVFAYGKVPHPETYKYHFENQNNHYWVCVRPVKAVDVMGLVERTRQKF